MQKATETVTHKKETCKSVIAQVFQLYSNLLMEDARWPWNKILGEQIEVTPWTDLCVVENTALVGNVGNMSAHVATMLTLSAKNWLMSNVADTVTGFMAGSRVG